MAALDALGEPALHGVGHRVEQRRRSASRSSRVNGAEHVVGQVVGPVGLGPDPDAEPGVVLPPQRGLDALEPVVATGRAGAAQPEPS